MKVPSALLTVLAGALVLVNTAAFTVGPQRTIHSVNALETQTALYSFQPKEFVETEVASNDVVLFSKSYCPFCDGAKALFTKLGVDFQVHELDQSEHGPDLQSALQEMSGQRTVPNVFVKGNHIGGFDDTQAAAKKGELQDMLGISN